METLTEGNPGLVIYLPELNFPDAVAQKCSVKKVFLKISQNSQESTCTRTSLPVAASYFQTSSKQ